MGTLIHSGSRGWRGKRGESTGKGDLGNERRGVRHASRTITKTRNLSELVLSWNCVSKKKLPDPKSCDREGKSSSAPCGMEVEGGRVARGGKQGMVGEGRRDKRGRA